MIDGASKENEKVDNLVILNSIATDIKDVLSPEEQENLQQTISVADKLLKELGISNLEYTKGALTLAIANHWRVSGTNFSEYEKTSEQLLALFSQKERLYVEPEEPERGAGTPYVIVKSILRQCFPEKNINWDSFETSEILKLLAVDGVVRLPRNILDEQGYSDNSEAKELFERAYLENPTLIRQKSRFVALYDPRSKIVVVWNDTPDEVFLHEESHKENEGIVEGELGSVLNEGMTELMTMKKLKEKGYDEQQLALFEAHSGYIYLIRLMNILMQKNANLAEALWSYYQKHSKEGEKLLVKNLISVLGLEGYLKIYTAHPHDTVVRDLYFELNPLPTYEKGPLVFEI